MSDPLLLISYLLDCSQSESCLIGNFKVVISDENMSFQWPVCCKTNISGPRVEGLRFKCEEYIAYSGNLVQSAIACTPRDLVWGWEILEMPGIIIIHWTPTEWNLLTRNGLGNGYRARYHATTSEHAGTKYCSICTLIPTLSAWLCEVMPVNI